MLQTVVQAVILLFITGIPAALVIASVRGSSARFVAGVAYLALIAWMASSDLAEREDGTPPTCAAPQGPTSC